MYIVKYKTITSTYINSSSNRKTDRVSVVFERQEQASNFMQALKSGPVFYEQSTVGHMTVDYASIKLVVLDETKVVY